MDYQLQDLIDIGLFQTLLHRLDKLYPFPSAIMDLNGKVLAETAWEDICQKFHCISSEKEPQSNLINQFIPDYNSEKYPINIYKCPHGMIDLTIPIVIEGKHLGNLFAGQVFLDKPKTEFFTEMARQNNFDLDNYLAAIEKIPVWNVEQLTDYLNVVRSVIDILIGIGTEKLKEIKSRKNRLETEERFKVFFNYSPDAIILADTETGIIIDANETASKLLGRPVTEIIGMHQAQLHPKRTEDFTRKTFKSHAGNTDHQEKSNSVENIVLRSDGSEIPVEIMANTIVIDGKKIIQGVFRDISSRKEIEAELNATEHKYQSLAENLPDIIARFDKNLRHIYVSRTIEQITGIPVSAYIGKTNEDMEMPPENVLFWNRNLKKVFKTGKQLSFEFIFQSNNSVRNFSSVLIPEFNHSGHVNTVLSVARDITAIKKSKQSLRIQRDISIMLSEMRDLDQALNQLLDFTFQLDGIDSGGIYMVDQSSGHIDLVVHRGLSEEFIKQNTHFSPDTENAAIVNSGALLFLTYLDIQKQNNPIILQEKIRSLAIMPILYEGKAIACFNLASHLYNEIPADDRIVLEAIASNLGGTLHRIRIGNQLRESEIKYKLAFQTSPDSITINSMNGIYVDINEGFTSITGYTREEVIGKSSLDINIWAVPEDRSKLLERLKQYGHIENLETVFRAKDGSLITALVSANLITLHEKTHILLICRDISDRKKAENELLVAKEKAEESNRLKTSFLANLSHELRTPMNGILGFAELLDDDTLTREVRNEYISVINDSGQSLLEVITNLMDISKIDSQQIESRFRSFNLNGLLNELLKWMKSERIYREKSHIKLDLVMELTDEESVITSDPGKIRHVISLLLHNAAKFTSEGTIRFGYSIHGKNIRLFVLDTGKGISRDKQETIFERFRQEDETMSRKYGGVGLGLTIAKSLVNLIGGKIMLESELGKGSTFWFEIPFQ